jgi:double-strand break repair protein MRE11
MLAYADVSTGKEKANKDMPDEAVLAAMTSDNIKVGKLVHEFLTAQSLKILPQAPFGDAVTQFVDKDDKHAVETFVNDSLSVQVRDLLAREVDDDDLEPAIERLRTQQEKLFADGVLKLSKKKGVLKPRPENWDDDYNGPWEDSLLAYEFVSGDEDDTPAPATKRGKGLAAGSDDDDASVISATAKKPTAKKAPVKKAPAKPRAPAKPKAPTKTPARGRKKATEPSDDEDEDVIMLDEPPPPPPKSQPKRAAATKGRQTQLNFSQSQAKTQTARELSDDEISDEDAFEPMTSSRRR